MNTINWKSKNGSPFYNGIFHAPTSFNKIFGDLLEDAGVEISYGKFPAVNVSESETQYTIETIVPGFEKEEIKISLEEKQLKISGEKKSKVSNENGNYTKREFKAEKFSRAFNLPENINTEAIEAEHKNGILYISLPKLNGEIKINKEISIK